MLALLDIGIGRIFGLAGAGIYSLVRFSHIADRFAFPKLEADDLQGRDGLTMNHGDQC